MDIQQLRYFVAVAEELHFARAADRLHITASPLSRRIRELERELGADLFVRAYHQVQLTRFGHEFLDAATDVLRRFDALRALAAGPDRPARPVREIGAAPLAPPPVIDYVMDTFQALYPQYELPITLESSAVLLDKLSTREVDLAIVHLPVPAPHLRAMELSRYDFAVAMRSDDELAARPRIRLDDLVERTLILLSPKVHPAAMNSLRDFLVKRGIKHITDLQHDDAVQLAAHVRRTRSLTLSVNDTRLPATRIFDAPGFALVRLDEPELHFSAGVAWRAEDETADPVLADVIAALRAGAPAG
jgi:DNA-binding transcriptional LysR family regulator